MSASNDTSQKIDTSKKMNVILDLDSTVINSLRPWDEQPKGLTGYTMENDSEAEYIVYERPHLQEFLDYLFANFRVAVWTAATKDYAIFIVENILLQNKPERKLEFLFFDYHTDISEKISKIDCIKDLNLVWNTFPGFNNKNTVIIDDYEEVYMPQICHSYPIPPFYADEPNAASDTELLKLKSKLGLIEEGECPNSKLITENTLNKAIAKAESEI
jgi:TFIIF-interacting CTD phosphatase-like protein